MKSGSVFVAASVLFLAVGVAGCENGLGPGTHIALSFGFQNVVVDDSVLLRVQLRDGLDNPLPAAFLVGVLDESVARVRIDSTPANVPEGRYWIFATGLGQTTIDVGTRGLEASLIVNTRPGGIQILDGIDTLVSGETVTRDAVATGRRGTPIPELPLRWTSDDSTVIRVVADTSLRAFAPGRTTLRVSAMDGQIVAQDTLEVKPAVFNGTFSPGSVGFLDTLVVLPGRDTPWDGFERFTVGGTSPWILSQNRSSARMITAGGAPGMTELLVLDQGLGDVTGGTSIQVTSKYLNHPTPDSALTVDLTNGPLAFLVALTPATRNDYFKFQPDSSVFVDITLSWHNDDDLDFWWFNCDRTIEFSRKGATLANPELDTIFIPAGECRLLWLNYFSGGGALAQVGVNVR